MIIDLTASLTSDGKSHVYIPEYKKMKFCEIFNMSPLDYDLLPSKMVDEWWTMKSIEKQIENQRKPKNDSR